MRASTLIMRGLAWMIIAIFFIPSGISAQDFEQLKQADRFRQEELDQMLAPIALYPDSLIAQILMASTYPLEIVKAERWLEHNKTLTGDALDDALKEKSWDPSIKSLCYFPDVLFAMSDELDQTSELGDAFLSQNDDVMATIQQLRRKAETQGNLKTTREQKVIHEEDAIRIEPAFRHVVYVPVYDPLYVYGPWWHSAYLPYYWYHPPGVIITGGFITFRPHFFVGIDLFSWSWFDWHRHYIYVNVHKAKRFHRFRQRHDSGRYFWRHNPVHRRGVAYRNKRTRERFGQKPSRRSAPGKKIHRSPVRNHKTKVVKPSRNSIKRREEAEVFRMRAKRKKVQRNEKRWKKADVSRIRTERERIQRNEKRRERAGAPETRPERKRLQIPEGRKTPFHGVGKRSFERKASERGIQSLQRGNTIHQGGNLQRQGRGYKGMPGT
ncbi:MAG: DUF3300 domain-containing protein [Thermodesulfobacteriota bacterium]|nr:DUF3300 domain-containing protein [Thermodesulfobacteriota bacterium]